MFKEIFNLYEKVSYERIDSICSKVNAIVFPKVRLADIINISGSGISHEEYRFALKSHFDFIVYNKKDSAATVCS